MLQQLKLSSLLALIVILIVGSVDCSSRPMEYDLLNYIAKPEKRLDPEDDEAVKRRFKAHFIREVFVDNMFKSSHLYYSEEESADYGLVNEMMSDQFAEYLSDTDFIDLSFIGD